MRRLKSWRSQGRPRKLSAMRFSTALSSAISVNEEMLARMKQDYQVIIDEAALTAASTGLPQTVGVNS